MPTLDYETATQKSTLSISRIRRNAHVWFAIFLVLAFSPVILPVALPNRVNATVMIASLIVAFVGSVAAIVWFRAGPSLYLLIAGLVACGYVIAWLGILVAFLAS
jgi:hypothetical protein